MVGSLFQKNPMTMVGRLDRCWLFTYHTPVAVARSLLPAKLEPVTHRGCAFWNIVVCHVTAMRPKYTPALLGISYWHIAYRLYVRCYPEHGVPIEGLYFLRSDCDNYLMTLAGNALTDLRLHTTAIEIQEHPADVVIKIAGAGADAHVTLSRCGPVRLLPDSAFDDLGEADAFLKYKPFGISLEGSGNAVNVVAITRQESAWRSRLVQVCEARWSFLEGQPVDPEICYEVEPIDYQWNRGQIYRLS